MSPIEVNRNSTKSCLTIATKLITECGFKNWTELWRLITSLYLKLQRILRHIWKAKTFRIPKFLLIFLKTFIFCWFLRALLCETKRVVLWISKWRITEPHKMFATSYKEVILPISILCIELCSGALFNFEFNPSMKFPDWGLKLKPQFPSGVMGPLRQALSLFSGFLKKRFPRREVLSKWMKFCCNNYPD